MSESAEVARLIRLIEEIGLPLFSSRMAAGVINESDGSAAIQQFVQRQKKRPLISQVSQAIMGRTDAYNES